MQRIETRITHYAQGAQVQADGLYLLNGSRHADLTSVVRHMEHDGATSQLIKGVARDTARGVFQGKIVVERGADGTDARIDHGHQVQRLHHVGAVLAGQREVGLEDVLACKTADAVEQLRGLLQRMAANLQQRQHQRSYPNSG